MNANANQEAAVILVTYLGLFVLTLLMTLPIMIGRWGIFAKAGKPGWAALVPVYGDIVLLEVTGQPIWWVALILCPCTMMIAQILIAVELCNRFNKGGGFVVGLILLAPVFYPILGFDGSRYRPPEEFWKARPRRSAYDDEEEEDDRPRRRRRADDRFEED